MGYDKSVVLLCSWVLFWLIKGSLYLNKNSKEKLQKIILSLYGSFIPDLHDGILGSSVRHKIGILQMLVWAFSTHTHTPNNMK